eukprot:529876_1
MRQNAKYYEKVIRNAMVLIITISKFDENNTNTNTNSEVTDFEFDSEAINVVFNNLNYCVIGNSKKYWKKMDVIEFIKKQAKQFNDNDYDALFVGISSYCLSNQNKIVCTLDFDTIETLQIHRMFSEPYADCRDRPRIFFYDLCDIGNRKSTIGERRETVESVNDVENDMEKPTWQPGQFNPDHKLVEIRGVHQNKKPGHLLNIFVNKILSDNKYVYEICQEMQHDGHQIKPTFLDRTEFIKFDKNGQKQNINPTNEKVAIEMLNTKTKQ